ncbi:fungal-specific transcription factor domain-containing protein [Dichotomocladium elegans]|nr:fungal-specific transcription factor domain-containing protein [Dichotomocladium elegans]
MLVDKLPKAYWLQPSIRSLPRNIHQYVFSVTGLDQYTSARLLKIYFANVHPVLPVIDKREFLRQYRDHLPVYPQPVLLLAMFGAAARFAELESHDPQKLQGPSYNYSHLDVPTGWSDQFFEKALKYILDEVNQPTLGKMQALALIQNQRTNIDSQSSAAFLMSGFAQCLGLHRNCKDWPNPENDKQSRSRTWWALYVCDRFQAALHGRPLLIVDEDNDVPYPSPYASWKEVLDEPEDDELDDDEGGPRFPSATYRPDSVGGYVAFNTLFLQLVKLSEIYGRIWRGLHTSNAKQQSFLHGSDNIVTKLDRELTEWRFSFSRTIKYEALHFPDFHPESGYFAGVIGSILLFYFTALILLHRPFIKNSNQHQEDFSSLSFKICTSAATRGIRMAAQLSPHDYLLTSYAFSLYPVLQCCLVLMYNTKSHDPRIAQAAKEDLQRAFELIDRIQDVSGWARKLKILLHSILDNRNIDYLRVMDDEYPYEDPEAVSSSSSTPLFKDCVTATTALDAAAPSAVPAEDPIHDMASIIDTFLLHQDVPVNGPALSTLANGEVFTLQQFDSTVAQQQELPAVPSFRNEPSNPFWDIPSSIDWSEWDAWYQQAQNPSAWDQTTRQSP